MPFKPVNCTLCENGWIPRLEDRPEALREACSALETRPCPECGDPLVEGTYVKEDGSDFTAWACIECNRMYSDGETIDG